LPQLIKDSQPTDGRHLILTEADKTELLANEPQAEKWIRTNISWRGISKWWSEILFMVERH
jgi:hypothetical protein